MKDLNVAQLCQAMVIQHTWSVGSLSLCCLMMYLVPTTMSFRFDILFIRVVVIGIEFSRDVILALLFKQKENKTINALQWSFLVS